ncbi:MAG: serine/threonine protein kinase, partial [Pseudomonadota bacterium]
MAVEFGRYQLLRKIAAGGMGQVFLARTGASGFEKVLVIKRILPSLGEDEDFVEMFFDEARIAARLNH